MKLKDFLFLLYAGKKKIFEQFNLILDIRYAFQYQ